MSNVDASVETAYNLVPGLELLRLPAGQSVASAVAALSRNPRVEYAVPDLAVKGATTTTPNDPLYSSQWAPAAIGAPQAWDRTTGSASVTVAVLDTGVQLDHPDLAANLIPGWNFMTYNNTTSPADDNGHGTIVSGIIGAVGDNGVGITGINWHVSLMPLKICSDYGSCDLTAAVSAIQYAVAHGAKIINGSYGGWYGGYQPEEDAIAAAGQAGVLFVAAAGNGSLDNDARPFYPASYPLDNIISVGATTQSGGVASFSDYGSNVLIGAPGENIESTTMPSGGELTDPSGYAAWDGTSVAAPQVSGAAALLWAEHPDWTMQQVRMRLLTTASPLVALGGGKLCDQVNVDAATDTTVSDRALVCVNLTGTGNGSVTSDSAAINCGSTCGESVPSGTSVTLTATPASGSTFGGWAGACTGLGSCTINAAGLMHVRATFRTSGSPPGWQQKRLAAPAGRDPYPSSATPDWSFYNVAVAAEGTERAKTIYDAGNSCGWGSDTGGVFLERHTAAGWVADGTVTAPNLPAFAGDNGGNWASCSNFGTVTQLSADGSTLLVTADMGFSDTYRCAAWVYQRGSGGWGLDTVLFPPGINAQGSADPNGCAYFGIGGAISANGTRIAMLTGGSVSGAPVSRADIYTKSAGTWSLEQQITLPSPNSDCAQGIAPGFLSLSGDGTTLLVGDPSCDDAGLIASGLVFAYARSGTQWTLAQTIESPAPAVRQEFGGQTALSEDGNTAVIGTYSTDANYSWVFERDQSGWHMSALLPNSGASTTQGNTMNCDSIVQDGARIICGAFYDDVSFNAQQGAILIFDRPAAGWASAQPQAAEAFATDGLGSDGLGLRIAAPENGSFIDATMLLYGFASGGYPHDRIGYEFTTGLIDKTLTVTRTGAGSGSITSNPTGVACGSICWHDFADSTPVTLTATPAAGSAFSGWSGACSGTGSCALTMSADRSATARFIPGKQLTVKTSGIGHGLVSSTPSAVSCSSTCSAWFIPGATVTLKATPAAWSKFTGWSGACTGSAACVVTMSQARSVTATFTAPPETLTVSKRGSGSGIVTSASGGISCGSVCSHIFGKGTAVTLTATAVSGSAFTGWSGACTGASATCHVSMTAAHATTATFAVAKLLTVAKAGTGSGQVTSNPAGISCGATCTHAFAAGTVVTLTAAASSGSKFTSWSGACSGTGSCVVTMSAAKTVKATFTHTSALHRVHQASRG